VSRPIALLTDFGHGDPYLGIMRGVILSINPQAQVVDLCHEVLPQNVFQAAFLLRAAYPYFPTGTIFVAVVDPGVGSARRILCLDTQCHLFLAPDNGLLSLIAAPGRWRHVTSRRYFLNPVSHTFHGRDIFAPVAAHLSLGLDPGELGPVVADPVQLPAHIPQRFGDELRARVVHIDHFGNLITNVTAADLAALRQMAEITGGEFIQPERLPAFLEDLSQRDLRLEVERLRHLRLWDNWPFLLAFVALLTAEWTVRKWKGLV